MVMKEVFVGVSVGVCGSVEVEGRCVGELQVDEIGMSVGGGGCQ